MKEILLLSAVDGIIRAIILWISFDLLFFYEYKQSDMMFLMIIAAGIILYCVSLLCSYHVSKNQIFFRFLLSIIVCISVFFFLLANVKLPISFPHREPAAPEGLGIIFYFAFFTIVTWIFRIILLILCYVVPLFRKYLDRSFNKEKM